jgi:hypothetical protein
MNFKHCIKSPDSTAEGYFKIPLEQRTRKVWFWPAPWYKPVLALEWTFNHLFEGTDSEFDKYYSQLKKEFPIQARIREYEQYKIWLVWRTFVHNYKDKVYYPARSIFKPENRHLAKVIPRQYKSQTLIVEEILIAAFLSYCEDGYVTARINYEDDPNADEETNKFFREQVAANKKIYDYIKVERVELKNQLEKAWEAVPLRGATEGEIFKKYDAVDKIEKEIGKRDTEALVYIIKNREQLD